MHVQQAIAVIKAKGLQENYEKLVWAEKECMEKLEEAVLSCDLKEGEVRDDSPVAKTVRMATEVQAKAKSVVEHIASQIFQLFSNFLSEEVRQPWSKILAKKIYSSPWKDLRGIVHNSPRSKTWDTFRSASHSTCSRCFRTTPLKHKGITSVFASRNPTGFP
jgi:hypothetical protein